MQLAQLVETGCSIMLFAAVDDARVDKRGGFGGRHFAEA